MPKSTKLHATRIELTESGKKALEQLCKRYGLKQHVAMSRMFEFFVAREEAIQYLILGQYPPNLRARIANWMLERMDDERQAK